MRDKFRIERGRMTFEMRGGAKIRFYFVFLPTSIIFARLFEIKSYKNEKYPR
jgi:hypothetical protein